MGRVNSQADGNILAQHAAAVTPSDTLNLPTAPARIYVGGAGNVAVITSRGDTVTFTAPAVGSVLPVAVRRVMSTNTTATLLVALY